MMSSDLFFRDKIPVAIVGIGIIGQKLIELLADHPWFQIAAICDSGPLIGLPYCQAVKEFNASRLPDRIGRMLIVPCSPVPPCSLVFSALSAPSSRAVELRIAETGYPVVSCSSFLSVEPSVLPIVSGVNSDFLFHLPARNEGWGWIVVNPESPSINLTLVLKPLMDHFGLEIVQGEALYPLFEEEEGCPLVCDYEEEGRKIVHESLKILGQSGIQGPQEASFKMSMQCTPSPSIGKDVITVSIKLRRAAKSEEIIQVWEQFLSGDQRLQLPKAPFHTIKVVEKFDGQTILAEDELTIFIGNLRPCPTLDYQFSIFSSHMMRGIVGPALLNAESLVASGKIFW